MDHEEVDNTLTFRLKDKILGEEIKMSNMSLPILSAFASQVSQFLRGSKRIDLNQIKTNIKSGSLVIEVDNETGLLDEAFDDYKSAFESGSIGQIDDTRASVLEEWQNEARNNPDRVYELIKGMFDDNVETDYKIVINEETNFKRTKEVWLPVEKYVYGRVYDLGGKNKANIHMEVIGHGAITIGAEAKKLIEDKTNRLYQHQLIRIKADENIKTHELKNENLISFENYNPKYDSDEFEEFAIKGTKAWGSLTNANLWLEELRGNA